MPPRTRATMGMDTPASNDEYEPTTTPGPPGPTPTTDTLIQMMMGYLKKQDEYLKKQDECLKRMNEYWDRRMGKSLQKSAENSDSLSRDQEDIKQGEDEMKLATQATVTAPPSTEEPSEEPTIKEPPARTTKELSVRTISITIRITTRATTKMTMMRSIIKNTTTTTTAIREPLKHRHYHEPKPHRCRKGEG
ncbi:hypothetical protein I7I50_07716 [Histoplasma capsulatum G186AR]|uniref:Uncharacterized protein n=1 Tax=Ajellomyces capsulatus TaxID=5037 RepID=A0A8H7Z0W9_AJECA|nr:hypothetical protein I7I52_09212 [Histoplasma capsulatum]QSS68341.1 hypothetical protein I7I50_07716 [Histoplasma capsulatum G186AR]